MGGQLASNPVPAVVVGGNLNGLGVARSLCDGRVSVLTLDTTRRCPAAWSRCCTFVPVPSLEGEGLIATLVRLARDLACRPVLLLTSDQTVNTVSACRDRIEPLYRIDLPDAHMVGALSDKTAFQSFAEQAGFAVPRGLAITCEADLERLDDLTPPLILKPADKTRVLLGIVERATRAETIGDARSVAARILLRAPPLIVQEWVPGPDTEIYFTLFTCARGGRVIGMFCGRKLVCSPPAVGSTAVCTAAPEEVAGELQLQSREFIERVGYCGLGSLEFKRDARTGRFVIIEPTVGRTDWQEEIATLHGVNLPLLAYRTALGEIASLAYGRGGKPIVWRSSPEFRVPREFTAAGAAIVDGYFRWRDLMPAVYYYGYDRLARRLWRRATNIVRNALAPALRET